ncbi:DUF5753 domain-containing protein [Embleya sp. NPDC020630]|uniref:DUF5753 domain-containing protein n=1 Tax=Embleya sp. NPDC020630 TaxID=3363979 RepID=UPI00379A1B9E
MSSLDWYESDLVPGLFQTADYAKTLIKESNPERDEAEVERRAHVCIERQTLLTRVTAAPMVDVVLSESVLRRPVGGTTIMRAQLERLVELAELDNVGIRIVAFGAGLHHGVMSGRAAPPFSSPATSGARSSRAPSTAGSTRPDDGIRRTEQPRLAPGRDCSPSTSAPRSAPGPAIALLCC